MLPARRGNLGARLLLFPFGLQYGALLGGTLLGTFSYHRPGGPVIAFLDGKWEQLFHWPFPISVPNIAEFLCQISILAILVLRFARTRRDEERMEAELEAARTVQQVLMGLSRATLYKDIPARAQGCRMEEGISKDDFGSGEGSRGNVRRGDPPHDSQLPRRKASAGDHRSSRSVGNEKSVVIVSVRPFWLRRSVP